MQGPRYGSDSACTPTSKKPMMDLVGRMGRPLIIWLSSGLGRKSLKKGVQLCWLIIENGLAFHATRRNFSSANEKNRRLEDG